MTIGDEPRSGGTGDGAGADGAPATAPGGTVPDDSASDDEVVDAELLDDDVADGPTDEVGRRPTRPRSTPWRWHWPSATSTSTRSAGCRPSSRTTRSGWLKQQTEQVARAAAGLVDKLLPVLDALDLATDHVGDADSAEAKALVAASGLLHGVLAKEGLERIDPSGEEFDPNAHEAVGQVPAPADAEPTASGEPRVAQVMRAGYRWHGTVVRPAMVMVEA